MSLIPNKNAKSKVALIPDCYSSPAPPGRQVTRNLGLIEITNRQIADEAPYQAAKLLEALLAAAREAGANAVVNVQLVAGSYQEGGSNWIYSYVTAYGDAVVLG
jgi:hypothetical protein